jgi:hypothetical protein
MARKKQSYVKGTFTHRRTEADYMGVLLDAVTLEDWRSVVVATLAAAKAGDSGARAWLGRYLVGKPVATAPAPLTVTVQQLSGHDPLVDKLAKPHIDRAEYPLLHADDDFKDALKARVADELRALEGQRPNTPETGANVDGTRPSADSAASSPVGTATSSPTQARARMCVTAQQGALIGSEPA